MSRPCRDRPSLPFWRLIAGALLPVALLLYAAPRWIYGERSAYVHVRWAPSSDNGDRSAIERELSLIFVRHLEGRTSAYYLTDVSRAGAQRLVEHPAVEDTHRIDRARFAIAADAPRAFTGPAASWLPLLLHALAAVVALGAALAVLLDRVGPARRQRIGRATGRSVRAVCLPVAATVSHLAGPRTTLMFAALAAIFITVLHNDAPLWTALIREDGPVENATSLLLGGAGALAAVAAYRHRGIRGVRTFSSILAVLLLLAALEEISWGQRILQIESPQFFVEHNAQEEINIHNTLQQWASPIECPFCTDGTLLTKHVVLAGVVMYGIVLPALLHVRGLRRRAPRWLVVPPLFLAPAILVSGLFMFDWFDVPSGNEEEVGELLLAAYLCAFVWHIVAARSCCRALEAVFSTDAHESGRPASSAHGLDDESRAASRV